MNSRGHLLQQAEEFAAELTDVLQASFPEAPTAFAQVTGPRVLVRPDGAVRLFVGGEHRATLEVRLRCELDSRGTWLAVETSNMVLTAPVDRTPMIRFEFVRRPQRVPSAHIQIHAHRGALSELLAHAGHESAHDMSALHIPVGGSRFRPCLEDVIQFAIEELGVDSLGTWQTAVEAGRRRWREKQVKATVRDWQEVAAEALRDLGYAVSDPGDDIPAVPEKAVHGW